MVEGTKKGRGRKPQNKKGEKMEDVKKKIKEGKERATDKEMKEGARIHWKKRKRRLWKKTVEEGEEEIVKVNKEETTEVAIGDNGDEGNGRRSKRQQRR